VALAGLAIAGAAIFGLPQLQPAYSTAVGEQRLVRLEDGSRIRLNTDSRVRVAFSRGERRLVLARGEAYFDVAHDARRPFIVQAGDASVRALGTRFDVRRDAGQVRVTLLEGRVRVRHDGQPRSWTLAPDQQLTLSAGGAGTTRTADGASATSWTTGRLVFHETPLAAAIAEVNRYSDRKVALDAQGLSGRLVNGVFDVGDTDSFVRGVAALIELKATATPDGSIRLQAARHADAA
jgi:transmembrane sensor